MAEAGASLELPYPETAIVDHETLDAQTDVLAAVLPERPLVLGGCCCAHVGAVQGLAAREGRLGVVWFDAHGDLNTPETSPSGNRWGMPFRMLLDGGALAVDDAALVGARNLDPPERDYLAATGLDDSIERALDGVDRVYVALDVDVLAPGEAACFMSEPGGPTCSDVERLLADVTARVPLAGFGVTGLLPDPSNVPVVTRLLRAAGL
jgi:arginase